MPVGRRIRGFYAEGKPHQTDSDYTVHCRLTVVRGGQCLVTSHCPHYGRVIVSLRHTAIQSCSLGGYHAR